MGKSGGCLRHGKGCEGALLWVFHARDTPPPLQSAQGPMFLNSFSKALKNLGVQLVLTGSAGWAQGMW